MDRTDAYNVYNQHLLSLLSHFNWTILQERVLTSQNGSINLQMTKKTLNVAGQHKELGFCIMRFICCQARLSERIVDVKDLGLSIMEILFVISTLDNTKERVIQRTLQQNISSETCESVLQTMQILLNKCILRKRCKQQLVTI